LPGKCLEVLDRIRKTKKQFVMLACVMYDLLGTFCVDEEVFLLYMEEALFDLLPADDMATVVGIRSHVTM